MSANLGGTEIFSPLSFIFDSTELLKNYPRNIFLITDGGVSDTKEVISLIEKNNNACNVFALGIGSGASTELINGVGKSGNGKSEFITNLSLVDEKVISLLKCSL